MVPQRVRQDHDSGCFVACVAMLLGVTYLEAFKLVHPNRELDEYGYGFAGLEGMDPVAQAFEVLEKLNLNPRLANVKEMRHLRRTAVVIIRWKYTPTLMHAIVFNPADKIILDPAYERASEMKRYAEQMDAAIYIKKAA
jgi:hypothetical protein